MLRPISATNVPSSNLFLRQRRLFTLSFEGQRHYSIFLAALERVFL
jgi:hypothetical protein